MLRASCLTLVQGKPFSSGSGNGCAIGPVWDPGREALHLSHYREHMALSYFLLLSRNRQIIRKRALHSASPPSALRGAGPQPQLRTKSESERSAGWPADGPGDLALTGA